MIRSRSDDLLRNGSGYIDPTAYQALKNYDKEQREMKFKRGQIYEYEVKAGDIRPALIVSADYRAGNDWLNIIVLNEEKKNNDCMLVGVYWADPGAVSFAWATRLGENLGYALDEEMRDIDREIMRCLGLSAEPMQTVVTPPSEPRNFAVELAEAKTEARVYRELFERLQGILAGCGKA